MLENTRNPAPGSRFEVGQGERFTIAFDVENESARPETYVLVVSGLLADWYTTYPVTVVPFDSAEVVLVVHPPTNAGVGLYDFSIELKGKPDDVSGGRRLTLEVRHSQPADLGMTSYQPQAPLKVDVFASYSYDEPRQKPPKNLLARLLGITDSAKPAKPEPAPRRAKAAEAAPKVVVGPVQDVGGDGDLVQCSVMAPPKVRVAATFMVQVFVHLPTLAGEARRAAQQADPTSSPLGTSSLSTRVRTGDKLSFELTLPSSEIDESHQTVLWTGSSCSVQFLVKASGSQFEEPLFGKVVVFNSGIPIGRVTFRIEVAMKSRAEPAVPIGVAKRYDRAFISYASADRSEVLRRVQVLPRLGISFFQDLLSLEPGDNWANEIYRHIDESDVLLLFWSSAAKKSDWVEKEWKYALQTKGEECIQPVVIEGPPLVPPPTELAHLHFNDRFLHFIATSE